MSSYHHTTRVEEDGKAEINVFYNKTKGGVDVLDKLCHSYSVQRATNRWPFAYFMNLINVAGVAAHVIWRNVNNQTDGNVGMQKKKFFLNLSAQLTYQQIKNRSTVGLSTMHKDTIRNVLGENSDDETQSVPEPPEKTAKRRCYLCPTNLDRKIKQTCDSCGKNVCNEHSNKILRCDKCFKVAEHVNSTDSE